LAEIRGHGSRYDPSCRRDERQSVATIARAIQLALSDAGLTYHEIGCVSLSANGSVELDRHEAEAVASSFDGRAQTLPVTAIKSMLGETLGASGAFQAVAMIEAMHDGVLPGINQLERLDDGVLLEGASPNSRAVDVRAGLINSVGLDGHCCSLILARGD
jgi:3-oxoacyl-[acyl-carrier-protein] synthase II